MDWLPVCLYYYCHRRSGPWATERRRKDGRIPHDRWRLCKLPHRFQEQRTAFRWRRCDLDAFGKFYAPNITPSKEHGIGDWSDADFIRAMRNGKNPNGAHYFPAFPYTSYTQITEPDLRAMRAYLFSLKPVERASTPHDISFPFSWRFLQVSWKMLFFREGEFEPDPNRSAEVNRGTYLANALAHCGECHTPRNKLGGLDYDELDGWHAKQAWERDNSEPHARCRYRLVLDRPRNRGIPQDRGDARF